MICYARDDVLLMRDHTYGTLECGSWLMRDIGDARTSELTRKPTAGAATASSTGAAKSFSLLIRVSSLDLSIHVQS